LDPGAQRYIDNTTDACRRLGKLIDELLQFSRLGRNEIHKQPADLNQMVEKVRQELEQESRNRVVRWHVDDLPVVPADHVMLRQVLENLLGNALKFTRKRAAAEIFISSRREPNGEIVISIRDNGVGFDMQYSRKLFQVFQRLHHEDEFEGTGIGLANVRRMVERHSGQVWAEGKLDQGATFYFSLPANDPIGAQDELTETHSVS
jgi:light-regulated signal transduction histidine kinase (bacteriophytochrome)